MDGWLCGVMMSGEIVGGFLFGSIALIADGLHMSTHAGALLLAALAYTYARKHVNDSRSMAMIALLIGYESVWATIRVATATAIRENWLDGWFLRY